MPTFEGLYVTEVLRSCRCRGSLCSQRLHASEREEYVFTTASLSDSRKGQTESSRVVIASSLNKQTDVSLSPSLPFYTAEEKP